MKKYIVREGDTMWEISKATGVRLNLLMAANPQVKDPNQLRPGSLIVVPELGKHDSSANSMGHNPAQQPGTGGQLAPATPGMQPTQPTPASSKIGKPQTPELSPTHEYYFGFVWPHVTTQGETWESISSHYGVSLEQLKHMNPELSSKNLQAGQVVYVPSPAAPPTGKSAHGAYPQYPSAPGAMPPQMPQYPGMPGGVPSQMPQYPQYPGMPGGVPSQMPQYPPYPQYPGMPGGVPSQTPQYPSGPNGVPIQLPGVQQDEQGPHTHNPYRSSQYPVPGGAYQYPTGTAYPVSAWYNDWEDSSSWDLDNEMNGSLPTHE